MMANDTVLFKTICPDYNAFSTSIAAQETVSAMKVYKRIDGNVALMETSEWLPDIYRVVFRRYKNWEIAFENEGDFLDSFWEKLEIHAPNYLERKYRYEMYLTLSDEELFRQAESVSNFIEHSNETVPDVFKPLQQITNQNNAALKGDKVSRLRDQIRSLQVAVLNDFLSHFKDLFLSLNTSSDYFG